MPHSPAATATAATPMVVGRIDRIPLAPPRLSRTRPGP